MGTALFLRNKLPAKIYKNRKTHFFNYNLVPRVLSYPPYGARERETLSLSRSVGRVGENPGNAVVLTNDAVI